MRTTRLPVLLLLLTLLSAPVFAQTVGLSQLREVNGRLYFRSSTSSVFRAVGGDVTLPGSLTQPGVLLSVTEADQRYRSVNWLPTWPLPGTPAQFQPSSHVHLASDIAGGTLPDARLSANIVRQADLQGYISLSVYQGNRQADLLQMTNPALIAQTPGYRFVSDIERLTWTNKQNALGYTPIPNTRKITVNGVDYSLATDPVITIVSSNTAPPVSSTDQVNEGASNKYFTPDRAAAAAPVQSVAGRTGSISLAPGDVGLGLVNNTPDIDKPISSAAQAALNTKEPALPSGSTGQYLRGNKTLGNFTADVRSQISVVGAGVAYDPSTGVLNVPGGGSGSATTDASALITGTLADARLPDLAPARTVSGFITSTSIDSKGRTTAVSSTTFTTPPFSETTGGVMVFQGATQTRIVAGGTTALTMSSTGTTANTVFTAPYGVNVPNGMYVGPGNAVIGSNYGNPGGGFAAPPGSIYTNAGGGDNSTLFIKTSGTGISGWKAITPTPTLVSAFTNDVGYLLPSALSGYATTSSLNAKADLAITTTYTTVGSFSAIAAIISGRTTPLHIVVATDETTLVQGVAQRVTYWYDGVTLYYPALSRADAASVNTSSPLSLGVAEVADNAALLGSSAVNRTTLMVVGTDSNNNNQTGFYFKRPDGSIHQVATNKIN